MAGTHGVFCVELPKDVTLDGELFGGRGEFQNTVGIVKTMGSKGWKNITFQVRRCPEPSLFSESSCTRIASNIFPAHSIPFALGGLLFDA